MSVVQRAQRAGRHAHRSLSAVTITYRAVDNSFTKSVLAVPGLRGTDALDENGVVVSRLMHDWLIELVDLPRAPERGDLIVWDKMAYRVLHPGGGREYELRDPYAESYRIHTVLLTTNYTAPTPLTGVAYGGPSGLAYGTASDNAYGPPATP